MEEATSENIVCSTYGAGVYQEALDKLEKDYEASFGYNKQRSIFEEFTRKFTTIPEIWIKWFELEADYNRKNRIDDLRKQALKHFYSLDFIGFLRPDTTIVREFSKLIEWPYLDIIRFKCYNVNPDILAEGLELAEKALTFPHWKLEEVYKIYSTKKEVTEDVMRNYRYSKFLMRLLNGATNDDEKWFTFLRMARNVGCIVQNIEYKICKAPWNVRLWRLYIEYLKDTNSPNVLNVYSRFCRFFVGDKDGLDEYRNEIQRIQQSGKSVTKWWIDTLEFELDFGTESSAQFLLKKALNINGWNSKFVEYASEFGKKCGLNDAEIESLISVQKAPSTSAPSSSTNENIDLEQEMDIQNDEYEDFSDLSTFYEPWGQRFSIPSTILFYVLETSDHELLSKLFATCKLFFSKFKVILCHGLDITLSGRRGFSPSGSSIDLELNQICNFYITNNLTVTSEPNRNMLVWLRTALYRCDAEILNISGQDIPLATFGFFISKVTNITLQDCNIFNENGENLAIEDIIALFPNADKLKFSSNRFTPQTLTALNEMERPVLMTSFVLYNVPQTFSSEQFAVFMRRNAAPSAAFSIYFSEDTPELTKQEFFVTVRHALITIAHNPPRLTVF